MFGLCILFFCISTILSCDVNFSCDKCTELDCSYVVTKGYDSFCVKDIDTIRNIKIVIEDFFGCHVAEKLMSRKHRVEKMDNNFGVPTILAGNVNPQVDESITFFAPVSTLRTKLHLGTTRPFLPNTNTSIFPTTIPPNISDRKASVYPKTTSSYGSVRVAAIIPTIIQPILPPIKPTIIPVTIPSILPTVEAGILTTAIPPYLPKIKSAYIPVTMPPNLPNVKAGILTATIPPHLPTIKSAINPVTMPPILPTIKEATNLTNTQPKFPSMERITTPPTSVLMRNASTIPPTKAKPRSIKGIQTYVGVIPVGNINSTNEESQIPSNSTVLVISGRKAVQKSDSTLSDSVELFSLLPRRYQCVNGKRNETLLLSYASSLCSIARLSERHGISSFAATDQAWFLLNPARRANGTCTSIQKYRQLCRTHGKRKLRHSKTGLTRGRRSPLFERIDSLWRCDNKKKEGLLNRLARVICYSGDIFLELKETTRLHNYDLAFGLMTPSFRHSFKCSNLYYRKRRCYN